MQVRAAELKRHPYRHELSLSGGNEDVLHTWSDRELSLSSIERGTVRSRVPSLTSIKPSTRMRQSFFLQTHGVQPSYKRAKLSVLWASRITYSTCSAVVYFLVGWGSHPSSFIRTRCQTFSAYAFRSWTAVKKKKKVCIYIKKERKRNKKKI